MVKHVLSKYVMEEKLIALKNTVIIKIAVAAYARGVWGHAPQKFFEMLTLFDAI